MEKVLEQNEIIDLGVATVETRGNALIAPADTDGPGLRGHVSGIADD